MVVWIRRVTGEVNISYPTHDIFWRTCLWIQVTNWMGVWKGWGDERKGVPEGDSYVFEYMMVPFTEMGKGQIVKAEPKIMSFCWEMLNLGLSAGDTL